MIVYRSRRGKRSLDRQSRGPRCQRRSFLFPFPSDPVGPRRCIFHSSRCRASSGSVGLLAVPGLASCLRPRTFRREATLVQENTEAPEAMAALGLRLRLDPCLHLGKVEDVEPDDRLSGRGCSAAFSLLDLELLSVSREHGAPLPARLFGRPGRLHATRPRSGSRGRPHPGALGPQHSS